MLGRVLMQDLNPNIQRVLHQHGIFLLAAFLNQKIKDHTKIILINEIQIIFKELCVEKNILLVV